MSTIQDRRIEDAGLEAAVARLTPEKIQKTVQETLAGECGARLKTYVETCVRCGMCAKGCHYYVSHQDPSYTPVAKVKATMWELLKHNGKVDPEVIHQCAQISYTECNLCRRCMHFCPLGIDTGYIMSVVRRICHKLGATPQYIQDTAHSHSATMNQMWVKDDEWIDSLQWQEDEARDEFPELRIPLEQEGAEIMYSVIGPEPKFRTQLIYQMAAIMHEAGSSWTMPATPGWDNSNMAMYSGDSEIMAYVERMHYETAQRLRVKRIVMGECGHAFRAVYDVANRWLGWRHTPVPMIHAIEYFWELLDQGKITMAKKYPGPVTIHDPCNTIRGRGLMDKLREVVHHICDGVVEMQPNREHNYCCCAGGGVINCGPPFKNVRVVGNKAKADQIKATGVATCVAPCHNCHGGLEDIIHHFELGVELKFLGDIIYECMEKKRAV